MDPTLILYAAIAAGLVFWLRSILGTRHGDERERPNPFTTKVEEILDSKGEKTFDMPGMSVTLSLADPFSELPRNVSVPTDAPKKGLLEIMAAFRDFDIARFSQGAQDAFAMIVESFANGDRATLKNLLEPQVYNAFDGALKSREVSGETMSTEIHAVRKMEILDARQDGKNAYIKLRFIADETCVVKDKNGAVLSGNPDRITEMNDVWTFSRPLKSREAIWFLHETRDGDVKEDHKTPVPDAG